MQTRQSLIDTLALFARDHAPDECCGLIAVNGDGDTGPQVWPMVNVSADPVNTFKMSDRQLIDTWNHIEDTGGRVVGYYHSHVDTPPEPSGTDLGWAIPGLLSVIISLAGPEPTMAVWDGPIPYEGNLFDGS